MKNKIVKFGIFLGLALVGAGASTSSYLTSSTKVNTIANSNQSAGLKTTTNDNDYVVLWDNPNPNRELTWNSDFVFNSSNVQDKSTLMAAFPAETWENVIKNGTFYLDFYAVKKEVWDEEQGYVFKYAFNIAVMDSWWGNRTDYFKDNTEVTLNETTNCHTLELSLKPELVADIDQKNLLFSGGDYVPQRIYYGTKPTVENGHYVNIYKRESNAYKNHGYITVDNEIAAENDTITATVNYVGDKFDYEPSVIGKDSKQTVTTTVTETGFTFTMPNEDVYITAEFYDNDFVVSFSLNGDHGQHGIDQQVLEYGNTVVEPEFPLDDYGFIFLGWFKEGSCVNEWNFKEDTITCDTTLYAKWREILSLKVVTDGAKTEYEVGDDLDLTNLKVNLRYNKKGEYEEGDPILSEALTFDVNQSMVKGYNKYKSGNQTINVCFNGVERSFKITVADFDVSLKTKPTKLEYAVGDDLDLNGAKLQLRSKKSGKTEAVDITPTMVSGYDKAKVGTQTITVTFDGKTVTFDVTVVDSVTSIAIKSTPTKTTYAVGEELDLTGAKLERISKSGKVEDVDITPTMVSGYDKTKVGTQTITVTLDGKTATFTVTVADPAPTPTSGGISTGALVGSIVGSLFGGAAIALGVTFLVLKKKKNPQQ